MLGGRLYRGSSGRAGEIGHVRARPYGAVCRCGNRGCLETVASAPALADVLAAAHGTELSVSGLLELVSDGDAEAVALVRAAGREIGRALADLCDLVNPQAVVVGGDLAAAGEPFLGAIRDAVDRRILPATAPRDRRAGWAYSASGPRCSGALALVTNDSERLRSAGLVALSAAG